MIVDQYEMLKVILNKIIFIFILNNQMTIHWHSNFNTLSKSTCSTRYLWCRIYFTIIIFTTMISFRSIFFYWSTKKSLQIKRKQKWNEILLFFILNMFIYSLTLQASHVTAPKWIPDDDALQIRHGNFLYKSSVFDPDDSKKLFFF